ncbi:MAG: ribose-phosphate pyrophosphokinase [Thermoprotei archaeon]|nr:ribose-phosphate diphosphokinase [Thermoproteales archaeon]RLE74523.1 MAG: ribose-phosphate pyrophosphokinase [Thermoprotei archaeon]
MLVYAGSASKYLGLKLSKILNIEYVNVETRKFPDGELYIRVDKEPLNEKALIVQSMYKTPNDYLVEYLFLSKTLKELGAKEVIGVIPYFPYARQDSRFKPGEVVSLQVVVDLLEKMGTDKVITVDMHLHRVHDLNEISKIPFVNLSVMEDIGKFFMKKFGNEDTIVVGPDEEAEQWAKKVAYILNVQYTILEKTRLGDLEVKIERVEKEDFKNKNVILIDDIISTGGTIEAAVKKVKAQGAEKVFVGCAHAILAQTAEYRIFRAGVEELVASDSIPSPYSVVSIAPVIADYIKKFLL